MILFRSTTVGTILGVVLSFGTIYVPGELDRNSYHSQVIMEREPPVWDLQSPALDVASALAATASATSLIPI